MRLQDMDSYKKMMNAFNTPIGRPIPPSCWTCRKTRYECEMKEMIVQKYSYNQGSEQFPELKCNNYKGA